MFQRTTKKPTGRILDQLSILVVNFTSLREQFASEVDWQISSLRAGEWLADLICLIPIHIAVCRENRFIPLKDGVFSAELERSLLGAEVTRIVDSLTFGWYESLFQSYMASKPVKVVSSMGEQSVGKSFALNHLADTSFAGSAMRTTEGVWLSFSTAIQIFTTGIPDVVDSDKNEITREFSLKFRKIVQDEQDSNFISRLHAGKLNIIPWPVIESNEFYRLFNTLNNLLQKQTTTHHAAGEFSHTLKTLMAKLKANDWGALSHTMAAHRAQSLLGLLPKALQTGLTETEPSLEPLKNFDTDLFIEKPDTEARFSIPTLLEAPDRDVALLTLCNNWDQASLRQQRTESEWIADLSSHLNHLADMRIDHVSEWISSNLARFQTSHASIEELRRTCSSASLELKTNIQLCKATCADCQLLCLRPRSHEGSHNCLTSHACIHECGFCAKESVFKFCGMSAGHPGKHVCVINTHLCGEPCELSAKRGCLKECTKVLGHPEDELHSCAARLHMCGEPQRDTAA
ncbi:hypothetical protein EWM64_g3792 [Hericium alpestre]|uniref:VLIG-type G domain-containing protein n=1 Tax=Hericium alpestre TaxID=135208 RepID=A0A4Z0A181_9AGAM|nr:hypothetical protein EWM64_g3792 [Hericium alpestre]